MTASGKSNIILIGMAGCGKSAVGRRLAELLHLSFVDTDDLIVRAQGRPLQEIINSRGPHAFRRIEEEVLLGINPRRHVIATGGSTIYSPAGMAHLRRIGYIVLLRVDLAVLQARVDNVPTRGLVRQPQQTFADLYRERLPLYLKYAEYSYDCGRQGIEEVCRGLVSLLPDFSSGSG
jgi:shikimate kinase